MNPQHLTQRINNIHKYYILFCRVLLDAHKGHHHTWSSNPLILSELKNFDSLIQSSHQHPTFWSYNASPLHCPTLQYREHIRSVQSVMINHNFIWLIIKCYIITSSEYHSCITTEVNTKQHSWVVIVTRWSQGHFVELITSLFCGLKISCWGNDIFLM